jgi:hypothetical protein
LEHTVDTLSALFKWKIGAFRFKHLLKRSVRPLFLSNLEKAKALPRDISAERFLSAFPEGGAIHRIFWLHCWRPRTFPIYDQHVHRAMVFIKTGQIEELSSFNDENKIERYLGNYLPFYETFADVDLDFDLTRDGVPGRGIDRALVTFGSCIKIPKQDPPWRNVGIDSVVSAFK